MVWAVGRDGKNVVAGRVDCVILIGGGGGVDCVGLVGGGGGVNCVVLVGGAGGVSGTELSEGCFKCVAIKLSRCVLMTSRFVMPP